MIANGTKCSGQLSLSQFYKGKLEASFKIACKHNYCELKLELIEPLDFSRDIEQVFREIHKVFDLIESLKLDSRLGL